MSSFDKTAGKNLDEILASIRKTLADESPPTEANAGEPNAPVDTKAAAAVPPNGSKTPAAKIDEDLADLLAGGLGVPASAPKDPDTAGAAADQKDPLWFLRPSGGRESQMLPLPAADRVSPSFHALADGPPNPAAERSSLAPRFVADNGSANGQPSPTAADPPPPAQATTAAAPSPAAELRAPAEPKPGTKSPQGASAPAKAGVEAGGSTLPEVVAPPGSTAAKAAVPASKAGASAPKADLAKPGVAAPAPAAAGPTAAPLKPSGPAQPQAVVTAPSPGLPTSAPAAALARAALGNGVGSASKSASVAPRATALNGAVAQTAAPTVSPADAAGATMVPTAQTQVLEQIIEQLLEPLLRRWIDANLPHLVDAAIRAEVARVLEAKHLNGQDAHRKV